GAPPRPQALHASGAALESARAARAAGARARARCGSPRRRARRRDPARVRALAAESKRVPTGAGTDGVPPWYVENRDDAAPLRRSGAGAVLRAKRGFGERMESIEHIVVGAGPAGLRAAQVLAEAGRDVVVLERRLEVGPKTCG